MSNHARRRAHGPAWRRAVKPRVRKRNLRRIREAAKR